MNDNSGTYPYDTGDFWMSDELKASIREKSGSTFSESLSACTGAANTLEAAPASQSAIGTKIGTRRNSGGSAPTFKAVGWNKMIYRSHIGQDRWVAEVFRYKRNGFFLDFGSLDGILTNNTYVLEMDLGWRGICVEPNPTYYPEVCRSRRVITVNSALWPQSRQSIEMLDAHGLSSVTQYSSADKVASLRAQSSRRRIHVDTINPTELLDRFSVPALIDYMSLDVEGCELDVLEALDFGRYKFGLMTIEHGEVRERQSLMRNLLLPLGYKVLERFYDDWFYHPDYLDLLTGESGAADPIGVFEALAADYPIINV